MAFTTHDNAPYLYRKSGGGGDLEIDKLVGGTIAWNQIIKNGNFADTSYWSMWGGTVTASGNIATVNTPTQWANIFQPFDWTYGHVMLAISSVKKFGEDGYVYVKVVNNFGYSNQQFTRVVPTNDVWTDVVFCGKYMATPSGSTEQVRWGVQEYRASNENNGFQIKNVMVCDLTLMFGSTIADYVLSLEQSLTGSGLAWLRSYGFFTEDYYDYNSGELKSVSNLVSHDMTGKNLITGFPSITHYGVTFTANADGSVTANGTATGGNATCIVSATRPIFASFLGKEVILSGCPSGGSASTYRLQWWKYAVNSGGGTITASDYGDGTTPFIPTETSGNIAIFISNGVTVNNVTFRPMIRLSSVTDDTYEPYTLHSYPLGDVTLRGLPKLNGNALYYDGDTYESNGTVTRKYGVVTYNGSEAWYLNPNGVGRFYLNTLPTNFNATEKATSLSNKATCKDDNGVYGTYFAFGGTGIYFNKLDSNDTLDAFVSRLSSANATVLYPLATPTTETADTYTNPQWVDPNGTEKYTLSTNAFPMPVGHETTYNTDMGSKTVNTQVNLSMTEPQVRQVYAKEGDTARVLNIHLDKTEEDGTLRILRPDGTEVTADAVLVPDFYDGLMAEIPSDATEIVGKCYCDVEQNGVSSMPFTLNVKKNERES